METTNATLVNNAMVIMLAVEVAVDHGKETETEIEAKSILGDCGPGTDRCLMKDQWPMIGI